MRPTQNPSRPDSAKPDSARRSQRSTRLGARRAAAFGARRASTPPAGVHADAAMATASAQVISMRERRAEKKRMNRLRWRYRLAIAAGLMVMLSGLVWLLFFSPMLMFSADRVQVNGAGGSSIVSMADVRRVLADHNGERLVLMRPSVLAADVESIPEVAQADVHFGFPASVRIAIVPEVPIACAVEGSDCVAFAGSGAQLHVGAEEKKTLPKLTVDDSAVKLANLAPRLDEVLTSMSPAVRKRITAVTVGAGTQFSFTLDGQAIVRWGTASQNAQKNTVLAVLLKEQHQLYDVSAPTLPITQ
ncbi:MAG: FtsQ-type POTRA domain-containing protein [Arcanobacterium sp.]|nr:FtsQ-type POTRA domain-containing protein [Arcanobacterium sp.]